MRHALIKHFLIATGIAMAGLGLAVEDIFAKPPGKGPTSSDSPDPDYAIQTNFAGQGCFAYNPDRKGPGIAFQGLYDNIEAPPFTCALVQTSKGVEFYVRLMGVVSDDTGLITAAYLRGRNADNVFYDSEETLIDAKQAPMDGSDFNLVVNRDIDMFTCEKVKGTTTCVDAGSVYVGTLVYANLDN